MTPLQFGGIVSLVSVVALLAVVLNVPTREFWLALWVATLGVLVLTTVVILVRGEE